MAGKSTYLEGQLLNVIFRTQAAWKPSAIYIGLLTAAPTDAGGGTEVSGGSYARVAVPQLDANWTVPAGTPRSINNANAITFPAPTANWGVVTHIGIYDAATAGNLLYWAALTTAKTINNGDAAPSFASGACVITED
jgi:hypothetical protein